jgi:hypothetical protein
MDGTGDDSSLQAPSFNRGEGKTSETEVDGDESSLDAVDAVHAMGDTDR